MVAEAGFSGVEVWYPHVEKLGETELREVKAQCSRLGLVPTVIAPYFYFTRGQEPLLETLRTAEAVVRAAQVLGISKVRTFTDCGPDGLASGDATPEDWRAARDGLRELCAMDPGMEFVVETHEQTLADSLPSVRRLLDEVATPNLRLNYQATAAFLEQGFFRMPEGAVPLHLAHALGAGLHRRSLGLYRGEGGDRFPGNDRASALAGLPRHGYRSNIAARR